MQNLSDFEFNLKDKIAHVRVLKPTLASFVFQKIQKEHPEFKDNFETLCKLGAWYRNGKRQSKDENVLEGDYLRLHLKPKRFPNTQIRILYENEDFVAIYKPSLVPSHATLDNNQENALTYTSNLLKLPLSVTTRLDQETAGILVFAKHKSFVSQFNKIKISKFYTALTSVELKPGFYDHWMMDSTNAPKIISENEVPNSKKVQLIVNQSNPEGEWFRNEIELLTGRTHQIRAQLAFLNAPILGDVLYGGKTWNHLGIALACSRLVFNCSGKNYNLSL